MEPYVLVRCRGLSLCWPHCCSLTTGCLGRQDVWDRNGPWGLRRASRAPTGVAPTHRTARSGATIAGSRVATPVASGSTSFHVPSGQLTADIRAGPPSTAVVFVEPTKPFALLSGLDIRFYRWERSHHS